MTPHNVIPLAGHQVAFQLDHRERMRWHFGDEYPRPFFFPFTGPSGGDLTRMGHPGASNHDHHQSIWFAHSDVNGHDFWANGKATQIRQKQWLAYQDGDKQCIMASLLGWYAENDSEQVEQEVIAALSPDGSGGQLLDLQLTFRTVNDRPVSFGMTNFGFLAVRVAKSISVHFGDGELTNSEGLVGEPAIFGQFARWMDYSGPVTVLDEKDSPNTATEGITYFDHPSNHGSPAHWHVRSDGWMGAAPCMHAALGIDPGQSLTFRYLLHAHSGGADIERSDALYAGFASSPGYVVEKSQRKHRSWDVGRAVH